MNEHGKSDRSMVPEKSPNKAVQAVAEGMEGRDLAEGNSHQQNTIRTQSRGSVPSALERVRQAARKDKETWWHYGETLGENLPDLTHRLPRKHITPNLRAACASRPKARAG